MPFVHVLYRGEDSAIAALIPEWALRAKSIKECAPIFVAGITVGDNIVPPIGNYAAGVEHACGYKQIVVDVVFPCRSGHTFNNCRKQTVAGV